jgi:hypothetical protein
VSLCIAGVVAAVVVVALCAALLNWFHDDNDEGRIIRKGLYSKTVHYQLNLQVSNASSGVTCNQGPVSCNSPSSPAYAYSGFTTLSECMGMCSSRETLPEGAPSYQSPSWDGWASKGALEGARSPEMHLSTYQHMQAWHIHPINPYESYIKNHYSIPYIVLTRPLGWGGNRIPIPVRYLGS